VKALLLNPPCNLTEVYKGMHKAGGNTCPQGLAYVAGALLEAGFEVEVLDALALKYTAEDLRRELARRRPGLIGISCNTPLALRSFEAARVASEAVPGAKIVMGGPHPSLFPEQVLRENPAIDFCVVGEGERTTVELARAVAGGGDGDLASIDGLVWRLDGSTGALRGGQVVVNAPRAYITDLSSVPVPPYHLFPMELYRPTPMTYRRLPTHSLITSRGCPYRCAFCSKSVHGSRFRAMSPERVMAEIRVLVDRYGAKGLVFYDDTLLVDRSRVDKICDLMIADGLRLDWACLARVNLLDEEILRKMKDAGCWQISLGLESGNQDLLDLIQKDITIDQIRQAVDLMHKVGLQIRASFMLALPGETYEKARRTVEFAKSLGLELASFCITIPYPGTALFEIARRSGRLREDAEWTNWNLLNVEDLVFVPDGVHEGELVRLYKHAWRSFYFSPSTIWRNLKTVRGPSDIIRFWHAFEALASI
jgi:radical SAM superfamily enzyme YgiQ (UPF0313 family)